MIWCIKTYIIAYVKTQKNKIHYPLCQTYSPTDFQKVDQHAGGKWLIHDTKRRKDNQLQSLGLGLGLGIVEHQIPSIKMF